MDNFATGFLLINAIAIIVLPRRWAPLPFLIGVCYVTRFQRLIIGPFTFTILRMLVAVGFARVLIRCERLEGRLNGLDKLMLAWAGWMLISSVFHKDPSAALVFRLGLVYDACGIYFLLRVFFRTLDDVKNLCRITAVVLLPVAIEMLYEKVTVHNLFSALGGGPESPALREGHIRAQGPFAHAILAGTVGAVTLPLMVGLWNEHRRIAIVGMISCATMIVTCASSGPILSAIAAIGALYMWHFKDRLRMVRWLAFLSYVFLDIIMKDPAYYVMARIDLAGGSTGWHRARLIQSSMEHLAEWWLAGTDYTRHWMASGVSWSPEHTDITNHYLQLGVVGGIPLILLFIAILLKGFSIVGHLQREEGQLPSGAQFMIWALGASLFAHAVTFISVSYYDQSFLFIYLTLAAIGSAGSVIRI